MEYIILAAEFVSAVLILIGAATSFKKKFDSYSERQEQIANGQKCQLRSEMLRTYYKHIDDKKIRQYEAENFLALYKAYKALGGNSFIDKIKTEVLEWEVIY